MGPKLGAVVLGRCHTPQLSCHSPLEKTCWRALHPGTASSEDWAPLCGEPREGAWDPMTQTAAGAGQGGQGGVAGQGTLSARAPAPELSRAVEAEGWWVVGQWGTPLPTDTVGSLPQTALQPPALFPSPSTELLASQGGPAEARCPQPHMWGPRVPPPPSALSPSVSGTAAQPPRGPALHPSS